MTIAFPRKLAMSGLSFTPPGFCINQDICEEKYERYHSIISLEDNIVDDDVTDVVLTLVAAVVAVATTDAA